MSSEKLTQAQLLRKQADMMEMAEANGIDHWTKLVRVHGGTLWDFRSEYNRNDQLYCPPSKYIFALGVVEGKPVFEGDILYVRGDRFAADDSIDAEWLNVYEASWNPPKQKTVMVELTVDDAIAYSGRIHHIQTFTTADHISLNIAEACRKALEEMK